MSYKLDNPLLDEHQKYPFSIVLHDYTRLLLPTPMTKDELNLLLNTASLTLKTKDGKEVTFKTGSDIKLVQA